MKQAVKVKIYKDLFFVKDNNKWSISLSNIKLVDVPFMVVDDSQLKYLAKGIKKRLTEFNSDKKVFEKILEMLKNNQEYKVVNGGIFIEKGDKLLSLIIFDDLNTIHISETIKRSNQ
jgi:hypothetical protein